MTSFDDLEQQLRGLDLQFSQVGEHLDDERLALITDGEDPTDHEAAHLSGCDDCITLLTVLGEGIESLLDEETAHEQRMPTGIRPPASRRFSAPTTMAIIALAACAFAGVTWYVTRAPVSQDEQQSRGDARNSESKTKTPSIEPATPSEDRQKDLKSVRNESPAKHEASATAVVPAEPVDGKTAETPEAIELKTPKQVLAEPTKPVAVDTVAEKSTRQPIKKTKESLGDKNGAAAALKAKKAQTSRRSPKTRPPARLVRKSPKRSTVSVRRKVQLRKKRLDGRSGPVPFTRKAVTAAARGFGQLRVNSRPAAQVYVDGKLRGWTPLVDLRLQEGPHDIRLVYKSPLADRSEEKFRVMITADQTWATVRDNRKKRSGK